MRTALRRNAVTVLETLIVITIISILAAMAYTSSNMSVDDQLLSAAQILANDLSYGRSLAVANNDKYMFTFNLTGNSYTLQHSGTNPALTNLPQTPFFRTPSPQNTVSLAALPEIGLQVSLLAVGATSGTSTSAITQIEFGPLGQTTDSRVATVWLAAGPAGSQQYISVSVNPVTGLASLSGLSSTAPPANLLPPGG